VTPAVGIANAYDAMHLTALAIAKAGSTEGPKIREAYYNIDSYDGLIKKYAKPFSPANQDALTSDDYIFTYFKEGQILPLTN
jgi:branched-chain amino acid transport system substrate-binding protein